MRDRRELIAELRLIAAESQVQEEAPAPDFGGDRIKTESYAHFLEVHPEWPAMYAEALALGVDPLDHWLDWLWGDEFCAACGKKGHKHHPSCKCRSHCS